MNPAVRVEIVTLHQVFVRDKIATAPLLTSVYVRIGSQYVNPQRNHRERENYTHFTKKYYAGISSFVPINF